MVSFYIDIFQQFPKDFIKTIKSLKKKKYKKNNYKESYFSIPTKNDFTKFKKKGGKIILFSDFFRINKIIK